uniref:Reverse transcriptase RNase H-like domain-containing protein n=1 Tax=Micrurus surinamensis TaxID=129470 RepID=A0A2D4PD89_MICSU
MIGDMSMSIRFLQADVCSTASSEASKYRIVICDSGGHQWQWELFFYNGMKKVGAYTSKKLSPTERNWAVWEKDAYTVHWPLLTWRQFLEGSQHPFKVWMDHKNLEALQSP